MGSKINKFKMKDLLGAINTFPSLPSYISHHSAPGGSTDNLGLKH